MNNIRLITPETDRALTSDEIKALSDHRLYVLDMADFLRMPSVDFNKLAELDLELKILLN